MVKLYISGIPALYNELQLAQRLAIYGEIATIKIIYDRKTKKGKGYAFIEMTDLLSAQRIIYALNGTTLGKGKLLIKIVQTDATDQMAEMPSQSINVAKGKTAKKDQLPAGAER